MKKRKIPALLLAFLGLIAWGLPALRAEVSTDSPFLYSEYSKTISMDFRDAQLSDVLKLLSQQSGLNFIGAQEVSGKRITLFLNNVPVEEALERILSANNLTYEIQPGSGVFIVKPLDRSLRNVVTRIYRLKYATVPSSKMNSTITISQDTGGFSSTTTAPAAPAAASTTSGIVAAIRTVLSASGTLVDDPRTNSLIITDLPTQFPMIEQAIARLDVPIPQILIEVEMLDVSKTVADKIGIKLGETPLSFTGGTRSVLYPWNQNKILRQGFEFADAEYTAGVVDATGLQAAFQFLSTQTDVRNLARPRILTLNNETAQIKISTNEAIGIVTNTNASQGTSTQSVEAERVQTGVFLTVTPQANLLSGEITMAVAPRVIQARDGATFEGRTFKDPEERGSNSIFKVLDGDTIVIGGLVRTDNSSTITKVPILGDIPFIGGAFRHKNKGDIERELIIFITPHIIRNQELDLSPAPATTMAPSVNRMLDIPPEKQKEIDKALAIIENQRL